MATPTMMPTGAGWPMPPPPRSRRRWIIPAAAAAVIAIATAIVVAINAGGPDQKPPAARSTTPTAQPTSATSPTPMVAPDRMDSILLTPQDVNTIMGATGIEGEGIKHGLFLGNGAKLSNPDCLVSLFAAQAPAYQGSGSTAVSYEELSEPGSNGTHLVEQAAVSFPSADQALGGAKNMAAKLSGCAGQSITESTVNGFTVRWTIGNVVGDVPTITQLSTDPDNGYACQRAMSAVLNVVFDVKACGYQITDQGRQIADKMTANVPH
jgi:PknH-like extracellular domain